MRDLAQTRIVPIGLRRKKSSTLAELLKMEAYLPWQNQGGEEAGVATNPVWESYRCRMTIGVTNR